MRLVVGFGARAAATVEDVEALLPPGLDGVVALSTVENKRQLAEALGARHGWPVTTHPARVLAAVPVPGPSDRVAAHTGTPSVAEAAALRTVRDLAGAGVLLHGKRASATATLAVAAAAPKVTVVGVDAAGHTATPVPPGAVLFGSRRQLDLVPDAGHHRVVWPSPLVPALPGLLAEHAAAQVVVLASGDPMWHGIGSTLVRLLGPGAVTVAPLPSAVSLACARLGWAVEDVEVVSAVGRSVDALRRVLHDGRRVLVLSAGADTPAQVAAILAETGFAASRVTVLESLGGPGERVHADVEAAGALNVVAVDCAGTGGVPVVAGLPDVAYTSDGQLTKREIRAVTLAALGPRPGELLWDVGAGSGSIAIEWLRAHRSCRAVAIERDPVRAARLTANAAALGVPQLSAVLGAAPEALQGLDGSGAPDAVFVGGGFTAPGVFERCWAALRPGGRLVVNAVTVESERLVAELHARHGGELSRIAVQRAAPVGGFLAWRPMMPVTQWTVWK